MFMDPLMAREGEVPENFWPASWTDVDVMFKEGIPLGPGPDCIFCGNPTERAEWNGSAKSWQDLAGRQYELAVCEPCRAWYAARLTLMN
jgi:hypothetical protein